MYAKYTQVAVSKSKMEIERTIAKYKASQFAIAVDLENCRAAIQFKMSNWIVRFELKLPSRDENDQRTRTRWRALLLAVKAKLESVESGIETFEEAFLPHIVMPGGQRFGMWALPQIEDMRKENRMPQTLLPPPNGASA